MEGYVNYPHQETAYNHPTLPRLKNSNYVKYNAYGTEVPTSDEWAYPILSATAHHIHNTNHQEFRKPSPAPDLTKTVPNTAYYQHQTPTLQIYKSTSIRSENAATLPPPQYVSPSPNQMMLSRPFVNNLNNSTVDGSAMNHIGYSNHLPKGQGRLTPVVREPNDKFSSDGKNPDRSCELGQTSPRQRDLSDPQFHHGNSNRSRELVQSSRAPSVPIEPLPSFWLHGRIPYLIFLLAILLIVFLSLSGVLVYYKCNLPTKIFKCSLRLYFKVILCFPFF